VSGMFGVMCCMVDRICHCIGRPNAVAATLPGWQVACCTQQLQQCSFACLLPARQVMVLGNRECCHNDTTARTAFPAASLTIHICCPGCLVNLQVSPSA
jgi:hypothetical protein